VVVGIGLAILEAKADEDGGGGVRVACKVCKVGLLVCVASVSHLSGMPARLEEFWNVRKGSSRSVS
jgi:hypothetical protein